MFDHLYVYGGIFIFEWLIIQGPSEILSTQFKVCMFTFNFIKSLKILIMWLLFIFLFSGQRRPRADQQFPVSSRQRGGLPGF